MFFLSSLNPLSQTSLYTDAYLFSVCRDSHLVFPRPFPRFHYFWLVILIHLLDFLPHRLFDVFNG